MSIKNIQGATFGGNEYFVTSGEANRNFNQSPVTWTCNQLDSEFEFKNIGMVAAGQTGKTKLKLSNYQNGAYQFDLSTASNVPISLGLNFIHPTLGSASVVDIVPKNINTTDTKTTFNGDLEVADDFKTIGTTELEGGCTVTGTHAVTGDITVSADLTVNGDTELDSGCKVTGTYETLLGENVSFRVNGKTYMDEGLYISSTGFRTTTNDVSKFRRDPGWWAGPVVNNDTLTAAYPLEVDGYIKGSEFHAVSSQQIKTITQTESEYKADLKAKFDQLEFVKYKYKDYERLGNGEYYGVISEQTQPIFPDLVHDNIDFVPNIYDNAQIEQDSEGKYKKIVLDQSLTTIPTQGESILFYETSTTPIIGTVESANDNIIYLTEEVYVPSTPESKTIYVFGTRANAPIIAYTQFHNMLGARLKILVDENNELKKRIESLEQKVK